MLMKQFYTQKKTLKLEPKKETIKYLLDYSKQLKVLVDNGKQPVMLNLN